MAGSSRYPSVRANATDPPSFPSHWCSNLVKTHMPETEKPDCGDEYRYVMHTKTKSRSPLPLPTHPSSQTYFLHLASVNLYTSSSLMQAWKLALEESENISKQHEGIAEGINLQVRRCRTSSAGFTCVVVRSLLASFFSALSP
jgi:hypothetical protein